MGFMGDRSTLLETGRFVRAEAEPGTGADETAPVVNAQTVLTDADFAQEMFAETDTASDAELEARHRVAADKGDPGAMSVLGALLLRRGDLAGAEPYLRGATGEGDRAAANNLGVLLHQRGYPDEAAGFGGGSPPWPGPHRPRTPWAATSASAGTSPPPSTGSARRRNPAMRWVRTGWPTCWNTGVTRVSSGGSAPPRSRGTAKPRTGWRGTCARATPSRPSSGTGRPPPAGTAGPRCTWAPCWRRAGSSRRPDAGT